ncbi:hypothetical protein UlMin_020328 [Ulmus minor]
MAIFDDSQKLQNPASVLDALFCEEEGFEDDLEEKGIEEIYYSDLTSDRSLMEARKEALKWIFTVKAHYGFSALTIVLAVNYSMDDSLTSMACLSLAAEVEETHMPLLLDLQRMHLVTPISFFNHIIKRLGLKTHLHWEFLWIFVCYLPPVLATATMLHVIEEIEPVNPLNHQNLLLSVLKINKISNHQQISVEPKNHKRTVHLDGISKVPPLSHAIPGMSTG